MASFTPTGRRGLSDSSVTDEELLLRNFARDLCTCTESELRNRWKGKYAHALRECKVDFESRAHKHNPIYHIARNVFFDNKIGKPDEKRFLYAPFHRDVLSKEVMDYFTTELKYRKAGLIGIASRDMFKSVFNHGAIPLHFALRMKYLFGRDSRICLVHHKQEQASAALVKLKDQLAHPYMKEIWSGDDDGFCFVGDPDRTGTQHDFNWPCRERGRQQEPSLFAVGLGGRRTGWHFDLVCFDDAVTEEHIESRTIREAAKLKYETSRFMLDPEGFEVYTDTPYHINDLTRKLIDAKVDGEPLYTSFVKGVIDEDTGTLLHPYRWPRDIIEKVRKEEIARRGNDILFMLQRMCSWQSDRLTVGDENWLKYVHVKTLDPKAMRILFIDPAWKDDEKNVGKGDDAAFSIVQFNTHGSTMMRTILDMTGSNEMTFSQGIKEAIRLMRKWRLQNVYIHERGGYTFSTMLRQECRNLPAPLPCHVMDLKMATMAKSDRIGALMHQFEAGRVQINSHLKGTECYWDKFRGQFLDWPQTDGHEDYLDATAFSCDTQIMEEWAPMPMRPSRQIQPPRPQLTRYCGV